MAASLYRELPSAVHKQCPPRMRQVQRWLADLPPHLAELVVAPVSLDVYREYEMQAERVQGKDAANAPCFYEFRYVLTQLRCDDDEVFYEAPVYSEALTSWRLIDERWLVCRTTLDRHGSQGVHTSYSVSERMPR